ncbi:MAG: sigma-70 family RNA polymerase sigma factor [Phycisphaerales bacterium]|nr:MAG: sigma-70 family RNA polymerase sigma factor [Phycisphaerales bacterium]
MANETKQCDWSGIRSGDARVWREFLGRLMPPLYGMFMKRRPNPSLAEELVQKTAFDAVRGRAGYDPAKGSPEDWIYGIARNNIRLEIRKRAARPTVNGDISVYLGRIDTEPLPDEVLERQETAGIVRVAMDRLASNERYVLEAKYIEGLPARAIARDMDITEKAVHSLLYRARISLREQIERIAGDKQGDSHEI